MSKYRAFPYANPNELVFSKADYNAYRVESIGRYVLTKDGKEVAFKNFGDARPNFLKWIETWETNARKQIDKLETRIADLRSEQNEIIDLLED